MSVDVNAALGRLVNDADGRTVLFWILGEAGIYRDAFSGDNAATNYILGSQSIGRRIIQRLDAIDPRLYPKLLLDVADMEAMTRAVRNKEEDPDEAV